VEDIYADGVADVMTGPAITKINFYSVESVTKNKDGKIEEKRRKSISVVMPTVSFLSLLQKSLESIKQNREALSSDSAVKDIARSIGMIISGEK
jgi:hypothetical protein